MMNIENMKVRRLLALGMLITVCVGTVSCGTSERDLEKERQEAAIRADQLKKIAEETERRKELEEGAKNDSVMSGVVVQKSWKEIKEEQTKKRDDASSK